MAMLPVSTLRNVSWPAVAAAFLLVSCAPDPVDPGGSGGSTGAGTGGQTGSGGTTPASGGSTGSGGSVVGTGGANVPGTGGAATASGGSTGSGGRQGTGGSATGTGGRGGTGGRAGTGGSTPSPDGGAPDGSTTGSGGAAGGASGNLPAGYAVCVPCHGNQGAGVAGHGPEIQHPVVDFATWVIRNGRMHPDYPDAMLKFTVDQLSDAQLQGILTYLAAPPKPTTGQALFMDFCANCHGANAAGGVTMRPINTEPMTKFTSMVRSGHNLGQFSGRRDFMPKWSTTELTDADIKLIFTYVDGL